LRILILHKKVRFCNANLCFTLLHYVWATHSHGA